MTTVSETDNDIDKYKDILIQTTITRLCYF